MSATGFRREASNWTLSRRIKGKKNRVAYCVYALVLYSIMRVLIVFDSPHRMRIMPLQLNRMDRQSPQQLQPQNDLIVAAMMAFEGLQKNADNLSSYERVQNTVLCQLTDPDERQVYLHYRALQKILRQQ